MMFIYKYLLMCAPMLLLFILLLFCWLEIHRVFVRCVRMALLRLRWHFSIYIYIKKKTEIHLNRFFLQADDGFSIINDLKIIKHDYCRICPQDDRSYLGSTVWPALKQPWDDSAPLRWRDDDCCVVGWC